MNHQYTIAVVDDDASIRNALRRLLQTSGYVVKTFASADVFLEGISTARPDCLLLDLQLNGTSGLQLQQQLIAAERHIPTVIISSHLDNASRQAALEFGVFDTFSKPVDTEELLHSISKALEKNEATRGNE